MPSSLARRTFLLSVSASIAAALGGCSGADNPQITQAPTYTPPEVKEPPKIPGRKQSYGANKRYQDAMERANTRR